jgi:hypothetical protein
VSIFSVIQTFSFENESGLTIPDMILGAQTHEISMRVVRQIGEWEASRFDLVATSHKFRTGIVT